MKIKYIIGYALFAALSSCDVDNYEQPSAELHGTFIDAGTNQPLAQDIINGTVIELIEHGFVKGQTNVTQTLVVKGDGTYKNSLIFPGKYLVRAVRGNFQDIAAIDTVNITGSTQLDFKVNPYLRIKEPTIVKVGSKVTATFKLEQTTTQTVTRVGLYVHPNPNVGGPMTLTSRVETTLNRVATPTETFTITIDLAANSTILIPGQQYYFRIGALSSAGSAKHNYAPAVRITI